VDALVAPADALPDHGTVGVAAANGVRIGIDLAPILRATGGARVRAIDALRDLRRLIDHHGAAHVVTATPDSHLELRTPRALAAVGDAVGAAGGRAAESAAAHAATLDGDWLRDGLREWGRIAARNRDRLSDAHVEPGVRRGSAAGTDPTAGDPEGADR
jgi:ribonuclease P/MRP protein subunit RPP1